MRTSGFAALLLAGFGHGARAIVRGVNLGGWLVTEPWMTPSLFNSTDTADEWHLCNVLGKKECLSTLENHWSTFYTRDDFVQIKAAGLTAVRIPLGYWAVNLTDYEPYVSGQYPYLIQAVQWAGELGLNAFIDIHGAPGSQNGWEETGLVGPVDFSANTSNSDRTLNVLKNLTTEFSKAEYGGVVTNIELLNEPLIGLPQLKEFYTSGYGVVGVANASGINTTIHDGFYDPHSWAYYDPNDSTASVAAPYLTVDTHQFWAFAPFTDLNKTEILQQICDFGVQIRANQSVSGIPPTLVGEWSLSTGITANSTTDAGQDRDKRTWFRKLFEAQNAAFTPYGAGQSSIGWYFWAWKTEYNIDAWSYQKGVADGYIPSNISDPSTYAFPLLGTDAGANVGCIDPTFDWTAPATVSSTPATSATATASTTVNSTFEATATAKSSACGTHLGRWEVAGWLGGSLALFSLA